MDARVKPAHDGLSRYSRAALTTHSTFKGEKLVLTLRRASE
jgi:hypothetical protein